jgi:hypothetical protein
MPISNYPHGFMDGVTIRGVPINVAHPGKVFWVNNSSVVPDGSKSPSNGNQGTYLQAFSSIDYAIGKCKAGRGDIIMVMPGHIEAVTATSIAIDVAGVAIIGLGEGALRPLLNFGATTSNIIMSAANSSIKNVILCATIDSVVAGLTITGANCTVDIETRDTSAAIEFISPIVTTATADNLNIDWKHRGFAAGDAMTRGIDLVGCRDAYINVDFFGKASTSVVDMRTTACDNVQVSGRFYNESAALTKNVTNNTTSTWSVRGFDAKGGNEFAGSDDAAVAYLSTGTSTALGTDGTTVTDSATTVLGAIGADNANNAFGSTSVVANADGSVLERQEYIQTDLLGLPRSVASSAKVLTTGNVNMFTVSGGPIKILELVGIVTTVVQAQATSTKVTVTTVSPAATVDLSAAAVDLTGAAAGASIRHINTTGILTVVTAGFVNEGNAFATNDTQYLVPAGTIQVNNASASNTGAVTWYMRYVPLSPLSRVV